MFFTTFSDKITLLSSSSSCSSLTSWILLWWSFVDVVVVVVTVALVAVACDLLANAKDEPTSFNFYACPLLLLVSDNDDDCELIAVLLIGLSLMLISLDLLR